MPAKIILKRNEERRIKSGHLWIFSNETEKPDASIDNGDAVEVYDSKGEFIGTAFFNKNSLIAGRIISYEKPEDLKELFRQKLISAYELRKRLYPERRSYRLVFSESDFLPGLIIDRYNSTFVLQVYSYGMQKNIEHIVSVLKEELNAENIFSKNESYFRKLEGLPEEDEIYLGEIKPELIDDGAVKYKIDFKKGHKTGFYFDQSDNRFFIEKICKGKEVADAFCNSGGFGLHAAMAGAASVKFLDSSAAEIESAKNNFELNGFKNESEFVTGDVFDIFEDWAGQKIEFDVVMIDPPAFAKSKKSLHTAVKGYEKLNRLGMQLTRRGGYLVSSSCSHHLKKEEFINILNRSALKAGRKVQLIHFNGASLDHPSLPAMEETEYLKFAVLRVE